MFISLEPLINCNRRQSGGDESDLICRFSDTFNVIQLRTEFCRCADGKFISVGSK